MFLCVLYDITWHYSKAIGAPDLRINSDTVLHQLYISSQPVVANSYVKFKGVWSVSNNLTSSAGIITGKVTSGQSFSSLSSPENSNKGSVATNAKNKPAYFYPCHMPSK